MANISIENIRRQERRFTQSGQVPTVPTVANHKTTGWLDTDIYLGEIVVNTADDLVYTRTINGIVTITGGVGGGGGLWSQNGTDAYYSNGNVGVNTSTPGYNLQVNGTMQASNGDYILSLDDNLVGAGIIHSGASNYDGANLYVNGLSDFSSLGDITGLKAVLMHRNMSDGAFSQVVVDQQIIDFGVENALGAGVIQQYLPSGIRTQVTDSAGASAYFNITDDYTKLAREKNGVQEFFLDDGQAVVSYINIDSSIDYSASLSSVGYYITMKDNNGELSVRFDTEHGLVIYSANPTSSSLLFTLRDYMDNIISSVNNFGHLYCKSASIGTDSVASSAILKLESTAEGFLPPRMTTTQRDNIAVPVEGLIVYNKTTSSLQFYNGSVWANV